MNSNHTSEHNVEDLSTALPPEGGVEPGEAGEGEVEGEDEADEAGEAGEVQADSLLDDGEPEAEPEPEPPPVVAPAPRVAKPVPVGRKMEAQPTKAPKKMNPGEQWVQAVPSPLAKVRVKPIPIDLPIPPPIETTEPAPEAAEVEGGGGDEAEAAPRVVTRVPATTQVVRMGASRNLKGVSPRQAVKGEVNETRVGKVIDQGHQQIRIGASPASQKNPGPVRPEVQKPVTVASDQVSLHIPPDIARAVARALRSPELNLGHKDPLRSHAESLFAQALRDKSGGATRDESGKRPTVMKRKHAEFVLAVLRGEMTPILNMFEFVAKGRGT